MTAKTITQLTALAAADAASTDVLPIVDVSDTTMAATGTTKKITLTDLQSAAVSAGTANGVMYLNGSKVATSGSDLVFDGANLGLGVTPSAWGAGTGSRAMDIGGYASFHQDGPTGGAGVVSNGYYNGANWIYKNSTTASRYLVSTGYHQWFVAPSGTAGNAISFTQAMALDASGNLLVGQAGDITNGGFDIRPNNGASGVSQLAIGHSSIAGSGTTYQVFLYTNSIIGSITQNGTTAVSYNTSSDYRLKDNQAPLTGSGAFIDALKPKTWNWKADGSKGVGFIAHEVQEVSPTSVVGEKDATRIEQYEISPAVPATYDEEGNELTPAVEAVMGEREVPAYQAMEYGSAEFIANIVAELQSLRKRVAALEA